VEEITEISRRLLRRDIPGGAGWVAGVHTGRKEFDQKDTAAFGGVANPGR
jgi:hypothetical protein